MPQYVVTFFTVSQIFALTKGGYSIIITIMKMAERFTKINYYLENRYNIANFVYNIYSLSKPLVRRVPNPIN